MPTARRGAGSVTSLESEVALPGFITVILAEPALAIRAAETGAVSCVAPATVVVSAAPFHWTTAPAAKFCPFTVSVNAGPPAVAKPGTNTVMDGSVTTEKVAAADVTGPGFATVTLTGPTAAICAAVTAAVSCVALTNVVVSAAVPHFTVAPATKLVPLTVRVKAGPPAAESAGFRQTRYGGRRGAPASDGNRDDVAG